MTAAVIPMDGAFTKRLPKIELHAHLTGSISRQCLHGIWLTKRAKDPELTLEDPMVAIPDGKVDYDINTFFPLFSSYIYNLCNDLESIKYSTQSVLHHFQSDNVIHLELRTTPRAIPSNSITKESYTTTILAELAAHNANPANALRASLILSVDRRNSAAQAEEVVDLALKYRAHGVVGVDLCGDPAQGDVSIFRPAFCRAKDAGLKITLHFAEIAASGTDEELSELLSWEPDRLGHVIHVNDEFKEVIERRGIGVEICLSCNVHAKMVEGGFGGHHFGFWKGTGTPVALSTDDVGVFCSPLSNEYALAAEHFNLSRADMKKLCERVVDCTFASPDEQRRLTDVYSNWDGWGI